MVTQKRFQHLVAELDEINSLIQLQLPTHEQALGCQLRQITLAQVRIERIENEVADFCQNHHDPDPCGGGICQTLAQLSGAIRLKAINFRLLAEEFSVDPEGTTACLLSLGDRNRILLSQLGQLKTATMPWWWSIV